MEMPPATSSLRKLESLVKLDTELTTHQADIKELEAAQTDCCIWNIAFIWAKKEALEKITPYSSRWW